MRVPSLKALFLRDLIIPLLCAILALGSLASARAVSSKAMLAIYGTHFNLCVPSGTGDGDGNTAHHECESCCLPMPTGLGPTPAPTLTHLAIVERLRIPSIREQNDRANPNLPWSRGPPALG